MVMVKKSFIKEILTDNLDMPRDVIYNLPLLTLIGDSEIHIENHKGIIEYGSEILRLNTNIGIIKIYGKNITIKEISKEEIMINGEIGGIDIIK